MNLLNLLSFSNLFLLFHKFPYKYIQGRVCVDKSLFILILYCRIPKVGPPDRDTAPILDTSNYTEMNTIGVPLSLKMERVRELATINQSGRLMPLKSSYNRTGLRKLISHLTLRSLHSYNDFIVRDEFVE